MFQFYDGKSGHELLRTCGSTPTSVIGSSESIVVVFKTDSDSVNKGWQLSWPAGNL